MLILIILALQYDLVGFKDILDKTLISYVTPENALHMYEFAVRHKLTNATEPIQGFIKG
jgi:hypothetical protein